MIYTVTSVEQDAKQHRRYHIYMDGMPEPMLSVHEDLLIRHRLFKGLELSASAIADIQAEDNKYRAYAMAIHYLGFRPRTSKEIEWYLQRKEIEPEPIAYAIERLEQERLIDDEDYARRFAQSRLRTGGKGRLLIKQELKMRGVDKHTADAASRELERDTEQASADHAAAKKWRSMTGEIYDKRRKLTQFLLRRGFPMDVAMQAVKQVSADQGSTPDDEELGWLDN
ncbi:regulatory protein [Paenibacillus cellulosilyticus]|uniref:Regulatory protein RecX n=1 Tax=Paenibacillus cellulosilyticus TaxID=375489 RepID=A0A2V2Z6J3_9BACL|nr:RecX family transcriptional regulator [Paenibacillus cellulosilyticus]PWW06470.1 regulatory protein [Paenibacillus cellulosilyticus]QKS46187.1 RecX family transcriptional regulator [Paenibacillus cellulosilyticus]